jgi:hypothetical protein
MPELEVWTQRWVSKYRREGILEAEAEPPDPDPSIVE